MTEASSERLNDDGTLPQDNAQPQAKESFEIYVINGDDMLITSEVTSAITENVIKQDNNYYTLQGIRIKNLVKGIYIKNGKKVIVK